MAKTASLNLSKQNPNPSKPSTEPFRPPTGGSGFWVDPSGGLGFWAVCLIIALLTFALYSNTLRNQYAMDDELVTMTNPLTTEGIKKIPEIFSRPYFTMGEHKYEYRPVVLATFAIEHSIFRVKPGVSHFINLIIYLFSGIVLYLTLRKLLPNFSYLAPLVATLLFIAHPLHTEAVASIKNRDELLCFLGGIGALFYALRLAERNRPNDYALVFLAFLFGCLSKRSIIPFAVVIPMAMILLTRANIKQVFLVATLLAMPATFVAPLFFTYQKIIFLVGLSALPLVLFPFFRSKNLLADAQAFFAGLSTSESSTETEKKPLLSFKPNDYSSYTVAALVVGGALLLELYQLTATGKPAMVGFIAIAVFGVALSLTIEQLRPVMLSLSMAGLAYASMLYNSKATLGLSVMALGFAALMEKGTRRFGLFLAFYALTLFVSMAFYNIAVSNLAIVTMLLLWLSGDKHFTAKVAAPMVIVFAVCQMQPWLPVEMLPFGTMDIKIIFFPLILLALTFGLSQPKFAKIAGGFVGFFTVVQLIIFFLKPDFTNFSTFLCCIILLGYWISSLNNGKKLAATTEDGTIFINVPLPNRFELKQLRFWVLPLLLIAIGAGFYLINDHDLFNLRYLSTSADSLIPESNRKLDPLESPMAYESSVYIRVANGFNILGEYLRLLVFPHPLGFYYGYDQVKMVKSIAEPQALISLIVHGLMGVAALYFYRKRPALSFALGYYLVCIVIFSNVFAPVAGIIGERLAYVSSLGFCMLVAFGLAGLFQIKLSETLPITRVKPAFLGVVACLLLLYSGKTISRNPDWHDHLTLYRHDTKYLTRSTQAFQLLGNKLMMMSAEEQDSLTKRPYLLEAVRAYRRSVQIDTGYFTSINNLATCFRMLYEEDSAIYYERWAIRLQPDHAESNFNLAGALLAKSQMESRKPRPDTAIVNYYRNEAKKYFFKTIEADSSLIVAYTNLSFTLFKEGKIDESVKVNLLCLKNNGESFHPLNNIGKTYFSQQRYAEAVEYFERAYKLDPLQPGLAAVLYQCYKMLGNKEREAFYLKEAQIAERVNSRGAPGQSVPRYKQELINK